jgi:RimJ/RimL family protein N-acetyltransferase
MFPDGFDTPRLHLRPLALSDAEAIFTTYARDPEVSRFLTWKPHQRRADTEAYVRAFVNADTFRTYVLTEKQTQTLCGAFDLRRAGPTRYGFGYLLARPYWGRGLMTEVLTEVTDWALRQDGIWRIGDVCDIDNLASARVMEKAGLKREGVLRRWGVHPNLGDEPRDCVSFAKVK